jgi:hypothetical protein
MNSSINRKNGRDSEYRFTKGSRAVTDEEIIERRLQEKVDRVLEDSFPASDPPSWTLGVDRDEIKW